MISWNKTLLAFGTDENTTRSKYNVIVECDKCGQEATRLYMSVKQIIKRTGHYYCHKCATSDKAFSNIVSSNVKAKWQDPVYVDNVMKAYNSESYKQKKRDESTERWKDPEFRKKMMSAEMTAIRKQNSSKHFKSQWQDPTYRNKMIRALRAKMIKQWQNQDYRAHMKLSQSIHTQQLWVDGVFTESFGDAFCEKMKIVNKEILSRPEVRQKLSITSKKLWDNPDFKSRMIANNKKKWLDPAFREKMAVVRSNQPKISSIQLLLYKFLDNLGVEYSKEGLDTKIGYYVFDCAVQLPNSRRLLIECQGDYWHSLEHVGPRDAAKFTYIDKYFPECEIMYVWEHEFFAKDRVLDRLKVKLGVGLETVDFVFKDISFRSDLLAADVSSFLDAYHYIGKGRGGICLGAYHGDELVAVAIFSPPLRQNMGLFGDFRELSRFCIHPAYHKKNFASWLLSHWVRSVGGTIVAYADTTVGHVGTIYRASNFILHHRVPSDYWYVDGDGFVMHKRTLYGRASKMGMSEADFAEEFGYFKKYGLEKLCYVYK